MITKVGAIMMVLMAAFCVPGFIQAALVPFWPKVPARVVSNDIWRYRRSVTGSEMHSETVRIPLVRVTYQYNGRTYEQGLDNADSLRSAQAGDVVDIRVCPVWPRWASLDARIHPAGRFLAAVVWAGLAWASLLGASALWSH